MTGEQVYQEGLRSFDKAVKWLKWIFAVLILVIIYSIFFRGLVNNDACNTIDDNNDITIVFLKGQEKRSIERYEKDPIPGYTIKDLKEAYHPFIEELEKGAC